MMPDQKINPKILQAEIREKVREFYPYFLSFYILSLIAAHFSKTWSGFFYWPAFHGSVFFFTLLFILTFRFSFKLDRQNIVRFTENSARQALSQFRRYLTLAYSKLSGFSRRTWLKILLIAVVLIFALTKEIAVLDFLILLYALISLLFIINSRWSAGIALILLASCPLFLISKQDVLAENAAIYAYYFLIITVLTQIRELKKEREETCG